MHVDTEGIQKCNGWSEIAESIYLYASLDFSKETGA